MTSSELVKQTLEFKNPERIPRQLWTLPWAEIKYNEELKEIQTIYPDDIALVPPFLKKSLHQKGARYSKGIFIDEWGCVFENLEDGIHGEVKDPIIKDWDDIENLHIPEERLTINLDKINKFCQETDKFVLPDNVQRPFERLQFLRRTDILLMDLVEQPEGLQKLIEVIDEFYREELKIWCQTDVDGIFLMDDWGAQNVLLINPEMWRRLFKPLYEEYIKIAHENGKYVFMHSDGHISSILGDLIEIGVDAINSQLFCMDIVEIGRRYKGQITFWGEIDRQHLLPYGSKEDIESAVKKVHDNLYQNGGIIAQCEFGPGARPENVKKVFETWNRIDT
ncbi:MAG: uroporphyrinogen decarboxylase family protein [Halanaerobiales bacterium]